MTFNLVTGGAGFIGSHLVDALLQLGQRVRVLDDFSVGRTANLAQHEANPLLEVRGGDVADPATARLACEAIDRVFHLAARADIVPSIMNPAAYFRSNVDGTFAALEAAREANVQSFIYAASSSCYGFPALFPTPETAAIDPQYPYALTKYLGERTVMHWARVYGLRAASVRLFNVYGPRARTSGSYGAVFGVFLAQLCAGKPLTVVGDGEQRRDFTYVDDVVDALLLVSDRARPGDCFNVGSGRPSSINELIGLLGSPPRVAIPKRPGEPDCTWADLSKITSQLGWRPKVDFAAGVKRLLDELAYWRDAPVWTEETIAKATADWFRFLR